MKIFSAEQIREWDEYTIQQEPVHSIDLMERAASLCTEWIIAHYPAAPDFAIFCGKGNNGGDGLAIARLLLAKHYPVSVYILEFGHLGTHDFQANLARLHALPANDIHFIQDKEHFPVLEHGTIIIDALLGTGLNRKLEGVTANLVEHINNSGLTILSIDIPSGMFTDHSSKESVIVKATHVLSFQIVKPAFLVPENGDYLGHLHLLNLGLHPVFYESQETKFELLDMAMIRAIYKPRKRFSHKGDFGHALLIAGSYGKMGAAVLTAKACLRSGAGLVSCQTFAEGAHILQIAVPEAMVIPSGSPLDMFSAVGIGPGLGTDNYTKKILDVILTGFNKPIVIDADALNILATEKDLLKNIPAGSILTPHPKEFERLFGPTKNDFERIEMAMKKAGELNCIIVLKGHHTLVADSAHHAFFNSTGNPGMATGGSGDVLTGILTGLLAQGYSSIEAAMLGVWIHGKAGDLAAGKLSMEALIAGDIVDQLGPAFLQIIS